MAEQDRKQLGRRQFIRLAGVSVVTTSIAGLTACSGGDSSSNAPPPKADPAPAPQAAMPKPAAPAPASAPNVKPGDRPIVSEDDPVAKSLGYKHDVADVDLSRYPKRGEAAAANHYCKNCVLYLGKDGDEWGGCSIFGAKLVAADGWCATYAPKA